MTKATQQEEALFDAARNLASPVARRAFLDQACGDDLELRRRIEALLEAGAEADKFFDDALKFRNAPFEKPPGAPEKNSTESGDSSEFSFAEGFGKRIGRYKLLQKIGEGGGGVVFMAEQEEPVRRRVALKVIKLGMDTKNVIARFEAERQALAIMDHLNIARVLDAAATETGRPYFVMELVRGTKITEYCDKNNLDNRQRLDLFIQICHAIQHAHQKGIIHRDIKPSNILITLHDGVPVPKVIDFGIAKATETPLTEKTLFTAYEQIIGTPAYMSPEQAELSGLDIDTRSDIYSLGVLLYELLTGRTPFDAKKLLQNGVDAMRKTLREQEPQRPSTMVTTMQETELTITAEHRQAEPPKLISQLRGDLDWIVMKALEKDRKRRYETANGLAMDIQRYLGNEPVVARPPSRFYRLQKLVRRNKIVFIAGAAVAIALLIGFGTSTWLFFRERDARRQAVSAEEKAVLAQANEAALREKAEARAKITQAAFLVNQDRFAEADQLLGDNSFSVPPTIESAVVFRSLGEWHALQNQWDEAANRFETLVQVNQSDSWDNNTLDYLRLGTALVEAGNPAAYRNFCEQTVSHFWGATNPVIAERTIKISLLLPPDEKTLASLQPFEETAARSFANADLSNVDSVFHAAWGSVSLSLIEYRRGNYAKAADWCRRCLAYSQDNQPRTATAEIILAMSDFQLGKKAEAASQLARGREIIENRFQSSLDPGDGEQGFWFDWIFGRIILSEAEKLPWPPSSASR
ncbi:MAG TPA: protein kinase [Pseudomonadales bacterium]|nr:protein kinase [Pseudomonadales bacterium]